MATSANVAPAVRAAFEGLVDYAGLFPPAGLAMRPALSEYLEHRSGPYAWMLGRFIVPLERVNELRDALPRGPAPATSVILGGDATAPLKAAEVRRDVRLRVDVLEVALEASEIGDFAEALNAAGLAGVPTFVEVRRGEHWTRDLAPALRDLSERGLGAKIRCGGLVAGAFPSPRELASFVAQAVRLRVPFKATAGLHHPVRHVDPATGFAMHGFLNVIAAAALARAGAAIEEIADAIACEDGSAFGFDDRGYVFRGRAIASDELKGLRDTAFVAYGSCSFSEPVDGLRALGMV